MLLFISNAKNSQVRAAGLAGAKALAEATVRARKAAENFMVALALGCWLILTYETVRAVRAVVVNSALVHHVRDFPLFFTSGNLPQSKRLVRLRNAAERNHKIIENRERSINCLRIASMCTIVPIKALSLDFSNIPISIYIDSNWPERRNEKKVESFREHTAQ